ncbi:MAG TPA: DUF2244 domain-containing protein [Rhodocyclaceae bacterium]|nr:DUF2244 domain-containing protein [Rhodocyclaceae bacterium]
MALSILLPCCAVAATVFFALGAWPVAVFMALPLLGLAAAFGCVWRHAEDFERITLSRDQLTVDRHTPSGDKHVEFNSQWVQVALHGVGLSSRLILRCQGKEEVCGLLLSDDERRFVARELKCRLARMQR